MYDKIKKWYKQGLWSEKMVYDAVAKGVLSAAGAEEIIAEQNEEVTNNV